MATGSSSKNKFSPLNAEGKKHKRVASWMHEHVNDHYVKQANEQGYRSRAAFKLLEIDEKDRLLKPGSVIVDLGCAPGSWSQAALRKTNGNATIIASDILEIQGLGGVTFIQGDFTEDEPLSKIESALAGRKADLVMSDMAPNMSGVKSVDMPRTIYLAELAADFALAHLHPQGKFLTKIFQGAGYPEFVTQLRSQFQKVETRKPEASRDRSAELFLLCSGLKS
jgi:23S rRNA (uridine2552-2'-O)-methyltransferase